MPSNSFHEAGAWEISLNFPDTNKTPCHSNTSNRVKYRFTNPTSWRGFFCPSGYFDSIKVHLHISNYSPTSKPTNLFIYKIWEIGVEGQSTWKKCRAATKLIMSLNALINITPYHFQCRPKLFYLRFCPRQISFRVSTTNQASWRIVR